MKTLIKKACSYAAIQMIFSPYRPGTHQLIKKNMAGSVAALQEVNHINEDEKDPLAGALDQYSLPPPK